ARLVQGAVRNAAGFEPGSAHGQLHRALRRGEHPETDRRGARFGWVKLDTSPEALAEELLGRPLEELDEEEQRALTRVASTDIELDPDEEEFKNTTFGD